MAASPDDIRGLNSIRVSELGALTTLGFFQSPVLTGLHHAIVTLPKLKYFSILWRMSRSLMQQEASEPDNLPS
jgi:hypothetical protein